jgi:FkbM family methyltransferase
MLTSKLWQVAERRFGLSVRRTRDETICGQPFRLARGSLAGADYDGAWLLALSSEAPTVFDIGCNIGLASLMMLRLGGVREAVLVDANEKALAFAAENLILNDVSLRCQFVRRFMSDKADVQMPFYTVGAGAAGSMHASHALTASAANSCIQVPTTTVDNLARDTSLTPQLIKIDVEGAESLVLRGAVETAKSTHCRFFVEMHNSRELPMSENAERVLRWCDDVGYRAWYLKERKPLESAGTIAARGRCHLLLLPRDQLLPEYLMPIEQGAPLARALEALATGSKKVQ